MPQYNRKDHFYQKAKKEGYVARSAYKLIEMDQKFKILGPAQRIVDLGCAPGGWLQVIEERCKGTKYDLRSTIDDRRLIGIDLLPLKFRPLPTTHYIQGNFLKKDCQAAIIEILGGKANWVLSDMSPNLSGVKFKDLQASFELAQSALDFATQVLTNNGGFIVKIFPGNELKLLKEKMKESFSKISTYIPEATRKTSDEIYIVAQHHKI